MSSHQARTRTSRVVRRTSHSTEHSTEHSTSAPAIHIWNQPIKSSAKALQRRVPYRSCDVTGPPLQLDLRVSHPCMRHNRKCYLMRCTLVSAVSRHARPAFSPSAVPRQFHAPRSVLQMRRLDATRGAPRLRHRPPSETCTRPYATVGAQRRHGRTGAFTVRIGRPLVHMRTVRPPCRIDSPCQAPIATSSLTCWRSVSRPSCPPGRPACPGCSPCLRHSS